MARDQTTRERIREATYVQAVATLASGDRTRDLAMVCREALKIADAAVRNWQDATDDPATPSQDAAPCHPFRFKKCPPGCEYCEYLRRYQG